MTEGIMACAVQGWKVLPHEEHHGGRNMGESAGLESVCYLLINSMPTVKEARLREAEAKVMSQVSHTTKSRAAGQSGSYV